MQPSIFVCPLCRAPLAPDSDNRALRCASGHSFDRAAKGYVHLLPSNRMHTKLPGDSKAMVDARRRFLDAGYYQPFSDAICRILTRELAPSPAPVLLDAGCGEGFYTAALHRALTEKKIPARVGGFDISKLAVNAAAGRDRRLELAVASCFAIPVADGAVDALLSVFSPIVPTEFSRVVRPGGWLLLAVAGERHLWGLKQVLYDAPYENEHRDTDYPGFSLLSRESIRADVTIEGADRIGDLFSMTPYYWKTSVEGARRLAALDLLQTELGFDLLLYRRNG